MKIVMTRLSHWWGWRQSLLLFQSSLINIISMFLSSFFFFIFIPVYVLHLAFVINCVVITIQFNLIIHICLIINWLFHCCCFISWTCTPRKYLSILMCSYIHLPINHKNDSRNVTTKQAWKKTIYQIIIYSKTCSQSWKTKILNHFKFDFWRVTNTLVTTHSWNR